MQGCDLAVVFIRVLVVWDGNIAVIFKELYPECSLLNVPVDVETAAGGRSGCNSSVGISLHHLVIGVRSFPGYGLLIGLHGFTSVAISAGCSVYFRVRRACCPSL